MTQGKGTAHINSGAKRVHVIGELTHNILKDYMLTILN